jgi:hypothetical protein
MRPSYKRAVGRGLPKNLDKEIDLIEGALLCGAANGAGVVFRDLHRTY